LISPIIIYSAGIKLYTSLALDGSMQNDAAVFLTLIVVTLVSFACQEVFYRLVEAPSLMAAKLAWDFMRR
jgi:hypothetical protein